MSKKDLSKNAYEKLLNEEKGNNYGTELRKNDPDEFEISYGWWLQENEFEGLNN